MTRRHLLIGAVLSLLFCGTKAQTIQLSSSAKGKQFDGVNDNAKVYQQIIQ